MPDRLTSIEQAADAELIAGVSWVGEIFAWNIQAALVDNSVDGDYWRPDGTYVGWSFGNWMLSASITDRWWGPGWDGSLILSTNARPTPGIAVQRNASRPFETRWLSWLGPWNLTTFMEHLDGDRQTEDPLLWGFRFGFRPLKSLEINVTRTAMWCGEGRPCAAGDGQFPRRPARRRSAITLIEVLAAMADQMGRFQEEGVAVAVLEAPLLILSD